MHPDHVQKVLTFYPRIFFACHTRHVRDPKTRRLLSAHQASILDHLDPLQPTALMDLARHMGVTPSTMSVAIDRLERRGYVQRRRATHDRRRSALRTTPAGERIKEAQSVLEPARVAAMMSTLSAQERTRGLDGLAVLAGAADRYIQSSPRKKNGFRNARANRRRE